MVRVNDRRMSSWVTPRAYSPIAPSPSPCQAHLRPLLSHSRLFSSVMYVACRVVYPWMRLGDTRAMITVRLKNQRPDVFDAYSASVRQYYGWRCSLSAPRICLWRRYRTKQGTVRTSVMSSSKLVRRVDWFQWAPIH